MNGNWLLIIIMLIALSMVARCDLAQSLGAEAADKDHRAEREVRS